MVKTKSTDSANEIDSIYSLVILAARRAVEIADGAEKLIQTKSTKPAVIAIEEIKAGKIFYKMKDKAAE